MHTQKLHILYGCWLNHLIAVSIKQFRCRLSVYALEENQINGSISTIKKNSIEESFF